MEVVATHECRVCKVHFPATDDHFYRCRGYFNWACKTCLKASVTAWKRDRFARTPHQRTCDHCGTPFVIIESPTNKRPKRFCSFRCHLDFRHEAEKRARLETKRAAERQCLHCGCAIPLEKRREAAYCSERCSSRAHALVRKLAGRAGTERRRVSRAMLGERDGWRCQICGKPIDRKREYPDPLAPSVDHRLPLALGGTNDLANLQLTHLRCNLTKHHYVGDVQLRLIG